MDLGTWISFILSVLALLLTAGLYAQKEWSELLTRAIATHAELTASNVGAAREVMSSFEYTWWSGIPVEITPESTTDAPPVRTDGTVDPRLLRAFYVIMGAAERVSIVLQQLDKTHLTVLPWRKGVAEGYRDMLAWHMSLFLAWSRWVVDDLGISDEVQKELEGARKIWDRCRERVDSVESSLTGHTVVCDALTTQERWRERRRDLLAQRGLGNDDS